MNNKKLKWPHLRALHELYETGRTQSKILDNAYIRNLKNEKRLIAYKMGTTSTLEARPRFKEFYENSFKETYLRYEQFLEENNIEKDGKRKYDEYDIQTLMFIAAHKAALKANISTIRKFSAIVFKEKGSKYLEKHSSIKQAVCKLLDIEDFPDKDPKNNQWRFVIDCPDPQAVVLCENLAHLKQPWKARTHHLELWYVGGNNISIINHIGDDKLSLPLFYSCDWDLAGLEIYSRIRKIIMDKGHNISLLRPCDNNASLPTGSPYHESRWDHHRPLSGLDPYAFSMEEIDQINDLIRKDRWIEEETQDLIEMLMFNRSFLRP